MPKTCDNTDELSFRWVRLPRVTGSPTGNRAVVAKSTRMERSDSDRSERTLRWVGFASFITYPAGDGAVRHNATPMATRHR